MELRDIEQFLEELGKELERRKFREPVRVLMVGGAFMIAHVGNRGSTQDVDIILIDYPATTDRPLHPRSKAFREACSAVARAHKVPRHSINDDSAFFIRELSPNLPQDVLWQSYSMLQVYVPPKEYILALKLMTFRAKDRDDVMVLLTQVGISTRAQAQELLDRYIDQNLYADYEVPKTLRLLFGRE